jgi:ABC-type antimicrobial peptide transport system permease subunit
MRLILLEASQIGLPGGLPGVLGGYFGPSALRFIGASGGLPQADPSMVHFGEAMLLALGISAAAGFLPAYRAARCSPIAALRHE